MTRRKLFAVGLGLYVAALIASLPASLLDGVLERASHGRLRLIEAEGTLWSGAGRIEFRDADGRRGLAKGIAWRCLPRPFGGRLVFEVSLEPSSQRFPVTVSLSGIDIAAADIDLPAAVLGLALPKLAPLGLGGEVRIRVAKISLRGGRLRGAAALQWRAARSALTPVAPLGDYELRLDGERLALRSLRGPLWMEGAESGTSAGAREFVAMLRVPASLRQELVPLLRLIAVERGTGVFELRLK